MIEYRAAEDRFVTRSEGRTTFHSFSFGAHYDPGNVGFASLVAHNDERLPPGTGYDDHPHADLEIVTWVLGGALRHTSTVGSGVVVPGQVQRLSAGSGIVHAEVQEGTEPTRFLQAWVRPDEPGATPGYRAAEVALGVDWAVVAGDDGAVPIGATGARLLVARPPAGHRTALPDAPHLHVFVASGAVMLGERLLRPGDTARLVDEGARPLVVEEDAEVVVWSFDGSAYGPA